MARAVASPTAAASVRIFFIRSSGAKGLPFWMPIEAQKPSVVGSMGSAGLLLHHLIEHLPEAVIRRGDHVEGLAGDVHEFQASADLPAWDSG